MAAASRDQTGILLNQAAGFVRRTPGMDRRFRVYEGYRRIDALGRAAGSRSSPPTTGPATASSSPSRCSRSCTATPTCGCTARGTARSRSAAARSSPSRPPGSRAASTRTSRPACSSAAGSAAAARTPSPAPASSCCTSTRSRPAMTCTTSSASSRPTRSAASPSPGSSASTTARRCSNRTGPGSCAASPPAEQSAITAAEWARLKKAKIPATADVFAGVDLGWKWDTTAIVPLWMADARRRVLGIPEVIVPPRDGTSTDPEEIRAAARRVNDRHPVHTWVVEDAAGAAQFVEWLETEFPDARVVLYGTGNQAAALAFDRWMQAVRERWLAAPARRPAHAARPQRGRQARRPGPLPLRPAPQHPPRPRPGPARHRLPVSGERRARRRGRRRRAQPPRSTPPTTGSELLTVSSSSPCATRC
jgi:hypothetical protein